MSDLIKQTRSWLVWKAKSAPTSALTGRKKNWRQNLSNYAEARQFCIENEGYRLGFCFTPEVPVIGLDFDGCRNPETGEIEPWALELMTDSGLILSNVSVSGTGIKTIHHCNQDLKRVVRNFEGVTSYGDHSPQIELFANNKYFALTIDEFGDVGDVGQIELTQLFRIMGTSDLFPEQRDDEGDTAEPGTTNTNDLRRLLGRLDVLNYQDRETWIRIMQAAHHGTGGSAEAFEVFDEWCQGDPDSYNEEDVKRDWDSMKPNPNNPVTIATLIQAAYPEGGQGEPDPAEFFEPVAVATKTDLHPMLLDEESRNHKDTGELFEREYNGLVRYVGEWGKWVYYDGTCWRIDNGKQGVHGRVLGFIGRLRDKIPPIESEQAAKARAYITGLCNHRSTMGLLGQIQGLPGMQIRAEDLAFKPHLLNLRNGTLNLCTMELQDHDPADFIFGYANVEYVEDERCPTWDRVVDDIFDGDRDLIRYVQKLFGYVVSGTTELEIFPVCYGGGRNGKSTLVQTIVKIMGDYSTTLPSEIFNTKQPQHPTYVASLKGMRCAFVSELDSDLALSESMVKKITSQDVIEARRMREDPWTFSPSHTTLLCTNHKPSVKGTDNGIWRRLKLIPFTVDLKPKEDKSIPAKLELEFSGILNWVLDGYKAYKAEGLEDCSAVYEATLEYRKEEDTFGNMFEELFEPDNGDTKTSDAFFVYQKQGGRLGRYKFNQAMADQGYTKIKKTIDGQRHWVFPGLRICIQGIQS